MIDTCEPVSSRSISVQLASQGRPDADAAILQFLVSEGISPAIAQKSSFRNMLRKVSSSGSQYIPPKPHDFGLNSSRPGSIGGLGRVLSSELDRCRVLKSNLLQSISHVGGTICNDGAKWRKRSVINSTLMTSHGPFFAQSTDATGRFKDANYLLTDIKSAISSVGEENVFIVALDGACKKTLKLIWNDPQMTKIFPRRCSTHGCNLLVADIGKHFKWEIAMCVRLVKFVCNHDRIFAILLEMEGSLQLLGAVETRFASQIYSSERILADKDYIKTLFYDPRLLDYLRTAPQDQRAEHTALEEEFVFKNSTWERIQVFVDVEIPIRTLLRISDGHKPNLADISYGYENARRKSLAAATAAVTKFPLIFVNLIEGVTGAISKRRVDIVTDLCLAAAMVLPKHVYVKNGEVPYDPEGGMQALNDVITRYYKDDTIKQNRAFKVFSDFREKSGVHFGGLNLYGLAENGTADEFWSRASLADKVGSELFRKLVNGYCGQGESERMNKQVKKHRTTVRNRQSHVVTASYMELDTIYKMIDLKEKKVTVNVYMECLREKYYEILEDIAEEQQELEALGAEDGNVVVNEQDEDDNAEYAVDADDPGRNAISDLLNAARILDAA